jgi:hypothetical protein
MFCWIKSVSYGAYLCYAAVLPPPRFPPLLQQDSRLAQQALLETDKTLERLQEEKALLESTLKYYSAASALECVFGDVGGSSSEAKGSPEGSKGSSEGAKGSSSELQPPPGGPD